MTFDVAYKDKFLTIAADYRKGSDSLLLFLHGIGCTKESFNDVWNVDELKDFSILIPDLVGYGDSSKSESFPYTLEDQVVILKNLLSKIAYKDLHIVAHSMGGAIGVLLADELGVKTFVNIEGNLIAEDCGLITRRVIEKSYDEFINSFFDEIRNIIGTLDEPGAKLWVEWSKKSDPNAFYKSAESLVRWSDSGELFKNFLALQAKKVYIFGEHNKTMPIITKLESNEKIEIPRSGHFAMNDNPDAFYSFLLEILKKN